MEKMVTQMEEKMETKYEEMKRNYEQMEKKMAMQIEKKMNLHHLGACGRRYFTQIIGNQRRIIGGIEATLGTYPYQISIWKKRFRRTARPAICLQSLCPTYMSARRHVSLQGE
jgi:hypothetical protein